MAAVLALGLDPNFADVASMLGLTPALVRTYLDSQVQRIRALGYDVDNCFVDSAATAEAVLKDTLSKREYDCVMIGAGLRTSDRLILFEKLINIVHLHAPSARICFNTTPADSAEAVHRCFNGA